MDETGRQTQVKQKQGTPGDQSSSSASAPSRKKSRRGADPANQKRRCVSTACIACRKRKSKCDGALPSCAACASVYGTECVYDPNSDHRRKGVYREKVDSMKAQNTTLQVLIEAILNAPEEDVPSIVKMIRTCDNLDTVADAILREEYRNEDAVEENTPEQDVPPEDLNEGEGELARKMGELRLENGSVRFIGGTSHLIYVGDPTESQLDPDPEQFSTDQDPIASWTDATNDTQLIVHLINMYFSWHYPYFTILSKSLFYRDFFQGRRRTQMNNTAYCSSLLVNAMLSLGCHFTNVPGAYASPHDDRSKGDHFFAEAKRLILDNDEYEKPRLTTVQALALMSVREAGAGREAKGWVYSGMSFRMAQDLGLNLDIGGFTANKQHLNEQELDARRVTFWGCFLIDKAWSNYLGRLPQIPKNSYSVPKYEVFPDEDAEMWSPYTDGGFDESQKQPARTRAIGLQLSKLAEISSDLLIYFYHPTHIGRSRGKAAELKKLSELHRSLEDWRKELPQEFEPKEGQLPNVILMHMFFHLQYIHLFRPFLKYSPKASPLPAHVSPRRICTANAGAISKLMRLYKKIYNLRQIPNIAVYMIHSACTIHILNLPEKTARRDIIHGVKHLEEMAEDWLCARRTLSIISVLARKWNVELPDEASVVLRRSDEKWGTVSTLDVPSPFKMSVSSSPPVFPGQPSLASTPEAYNQYAPQAQKRLPATTLASELMGSLDAVATGGDGANTGSGASSQVGNTSSMSMDTINSWAMPMTTSEPLGSGTTTFVQSPYSTPGQGGFRQTSLYAVDGQDYYLKDGVNWQQNFEGWGLGGGAPVGGNTPAAGGGGDVPDLFMFRNVRNSDGSPAFDSLNSPMDSLNNLPGLD
ncbi:uncharacterized protein E0L32_008556 [Thyridium curvatum]|uniref:Zn(2)-C6 fungal-type domain-containing protein n=1 Tax=Thyridium curvatum TaxID=1093900 RepID=A0A507AUW4_9PEZI|nr:uncharacterized protein E0L32_008556 [Thyridium curvatum]TPX10506.1 hypothetical protein E0L32_008556 [Thyridium curvatum]